ncbi:RING-H2 zinc finger protein RHA1a [Hordeum vulgare]|nr:RING-H2 zinc finger protein RHA1a [Hordeum vulgare]
MGFPAPVFSEPELPRLLLSLLFLLARLRRLSSWLLRLAGAGVDANLSFDRPTASRSAGRHRRQELYCQDHRLEDLEEHSPAMRFDALSTSGDGAEALVLPEGCVVCLGDFDAAARVRRPRGCRHVFHRACLDRWAAQGHSTCPLCRAPFLPPFLLPLPLPPAS